MRLPACGLYRTSVSIGSIPPERLVFFHNHGNPGPGVYLPESWSQNRAVFSERGVTLDDETLAATLEPLLDEGLYVVEETFTCCDERCVTYEKDQLVQLGYDQKAQPILFRPTWTRRGLSIPEIGQPTELGRLDGLRAVFVDEAEDDADPELLH
ncbi:MAG: hypothetical protein HY791_04050 [Deltaproteobacteria bacterium]|nr:hypothetical protein [Deltaproteobacteria bacterium]